VATTTSQSPATTLHRLPGYSSYTASTKGCELTRSTGDGRPSGPKANVLIQSTPGVETVTTGKFFKQLWPNGRALVVADGWYEWVKDPDNPKKKQPYFIRLKSQAPMFLAALAQIHTGLETHEGDGFVIITAASDQGMVDIHDRRPLVLSPEHAREWLDQELSPARAEDIAKNLCLPVDEFEWYPVGTPVGNVKNQGADLILPLGEEQPQSPHRGP